MVLKRLGIVLLLTVLLAAPLALAAHTTHTESGRYIAMTDQLVIWCGSEPHSILPTSDPTEYESLLAYLFSGEPECAPADALNLVAEAQGAPRAEWGLGGFAWSMTPDLRGHQVQITTDDALFDQNYILARVPVDTNAPGATQDVTAEGCGPQALVVPPNPASHWGSTPADPLYLLFAHIPAVGVDADLDVCLASTGTVTATWT